MTYKYDVFISYSRKDYKDEATKAEIPGNPITAITEAFDKNNISYWIDREGIYSGQEFENIIIDAIDSSKVFLFVSSTNSNESKWTKSEIWEAFEEDKYIIPFKIENIDYHKSLKFKLRPLDFIEYFSDKEGAIQDLVRSVNMYKEELAKEEKKQLEAKLKAEITEKIRTLEEDFKISVQRHEVTLKEILELHARLGTTTKICPICDKKVPLETAFCERCGWQFPALLSSDVDRKQLTLLKANWKIINTATTSKDEIKTLKNENLELKETIDNISKELEKAQKEKAQMADEKAILNTQIQDLAEELEKSQNEKVQIAEEKAMLNTLIQDLTKELEKSQKEKAQIAEEKAILNTQIQKLKEELEESQIENSLIAEEKDKLNTQIQDLKVQIRDLCYQINEKDKLSQQTNVKLSDLTLKLEKAKENNRELEQLYSQLNKQFKTSEKEYQKKIAVLENLNEQFSKRYNSLLKSSNEDENNYKKRIDELRRKIAELTMSSGNDSSIGKKIITSKSYIFNEILKKCTNKAHLVPSDDITILDRQMLINTLLKYYGIILTLSELNNCKRVENVIDLIAEMANVQ